MIPDEVIERVREEADVVSIIGEFVKLKRSGSTFRGPCPFHQGKHDNFAVTPRGGYTCFVCGEKGDVFTFVQKRLGLDFVESVKWVGAKVGVEVREVGRTTEERDSREPLWEVNGTAAEFFRDQLWESAGGAPAREYLAGRSITRDSADRFLLGYAPKDTGAMQAHLADLGFDDERQLATGLLVRSEERPEPRARFRDRLIFPISDPGGHIVGFGGRVLGDGQPKYLNSAETAIFSKGKLLYALHWAKQAVRKADRLIVVEGYFDAIRLMLAGIDEVVAPLGTALTEAQAALIRKYTKNVFLLYDSDLAGLRATFRAGDVLLAAGIGVRVITLPEGDDPDTFVQRTGADGFERAASASVDVFDRKIQILERGGWFTDLRRKREALDKLLPTIRVTADALLKDLYVARTAEAAGVSRDLLERELAAKEGKPRAPDEPPPDPAAARVRRQERRRQHGTASARTERELVRVLLHQRQFVDRVAEQLARELFTDDVYRSIFAALDELGADASVPAIAERLDEVGIEELQTMLAENGGLARADEVIHESVNALLARPIEGRLAELDKLIPIAAGSEKDRLIEEKRHLAAEIRALGRSRWPAFHPTRT